MSALLHALHAMHGTDTSLAYPEILDLPVASYFDPAHGV